MHQSVMVRGRLRLRVRIETGAPFSCDEHVASAEVRSMEADGLPRKGTYPDRTLFRGHER